MLYHGTSESVAQAVLKSQEGLKPRGKSKGNWKHTILSRKDAVYLTKAYAAYYAMCVVKPKERWAVIQIDENELNPFKLVPDEDALEQVMRNRDDVPGDMKQRTRWYRTHLHDFPHLVDLSLRALGNCCYLDTIPRSAIKRTALIDPKLCPTLCCQAMDPTITFLNYALVGVKYRGLTKWIFGEEYGDDAPVLQATFDNGLEYWNWNVPPEAERKGIELI